MTSTDPLGSPALGSAAQRRTRQRAAITELLAGATEFRTAQEVHARLRAAGDNVGLATVYRALQAMADAGELDVIRNLDGQAAYRNCSTEHHHHLICRSCGKTVEVSAPDFEAWAKSVAAEHGFAEIEHSLELFGRCGSC